MRFTLLTPGTGHFYCGSCLRDGTLAAGLRRLGHEVAVVPLYLPLKLEEPAAEDAATPVHMGGINMYLQQKSRLAGRLPRFLADLLDRPGLLRWVSRRGNLTEAPDLGAMTLSMLQGEHGRQNHELDKLAEWLVTSGQRPDIIVISNLLLAGVVRRLEQRLGVPVVATLQGEAPFLDALPEPFRAQAWAELAARVADIDHLIAVSRSYRDVMAAKLGLAPDRIHVVHNGLDLEDFITAPPVLGERRPRTLGYLARMCRDKGLDTLVDAFLALKERPDAADLRLGVAGVMLREDRGFVAGLQRRLAARGRAGDVTFHPNVGRTEKLALLRSFTALSVPATYGESFGLYVLEAMAAGVPVVQPRHAAFPEILEATGGGMLCEPDDAAALAASLADLLADPARAQELADNGRRAVFERFGADRMAAEFARISSSATP